jgi:Family of unknown function (DUF5923)
MLNIRSSYSYLPVTQDGGLKTATFELRTFLERFGNGQSMYIMFDATNTLIYDTNKNEELRKWFKSLNSQFARFVVYSSSFCFTSVYVLSCRSGYIPESDCNKHGNQIRISGRHFYDGKYKKHFDNLFSSVRDWLKATGEDPTNKRFGEDWARLTKDLLFDSEGSLKFKPDL